METDRIILRPWRDSDAPALYKWASDPDVGPRAGWAPHKSVEESLEVIRTVFCDATNTWAIELKDTGEAIGAMGYGPSCECNLPAREQESFSFERFLLFISHLSPDVCYLGVDKLAFN